MLVAAADSSTLTLSVALVEIAGGEVRLVADKRELAPRASAGGSGGHSARFPGALVELLDAVGKKLPDVEGYAIGLGPGSFTGLRIGLATWKGLAYGNRRPIAGVSSLAALALAALPDVPAGALVVPLLDAKKGEVYAGFYRAEGRAVVAAAPDAALGPEALVARVRAIAGSEVVTVGEGRSAHPALAELPHARTEATTPAALEVARLAALALEGAPYDAARLFSLEPHYVRPSEAEVKFPHGLPLGPRK